MQRLPRTKGCFVCGTTNPIGLGVELVDEGESVSAHFRPRPEHVGFKDTVHGGLIAALLDEVMVWVCGVRTGQFAYCAELTVRYRRPARPGRDLVASAKLVTNRQNRVLEAQATLHDGPALLLATATGKYIPVPATAVSDLLADFVGDIRAVVKPPNPGARS